MPLTGRLVELTQLTGTQREAMFALMQECYEQVSREVFEQDLDEKDWVILVEASEGGAIRGFSTQKRLHGMDGGTAFQALFSGDTVISPRAWGDIALPRVWGRLALSLMEARGDEPLYWFLISKGYKTYRFLPLFFHEFYPRREVHTPTPVRRILAQLAGEKFPQRFDATSGIVRARPDSARLRPGIADVTAPRRADPDVRFFVERNPGHADGDELCCLAPLTRANFTAAAHRVIGLPLAVESPAGKPGARPR